MQLKIHEIGGFCPKIPENELHKSFDGQKHCKFSENFVTFAIFSSEIFGFQNLPTKERSSDIGPAKKIHGQVLLRLKARKSVSLVFTHSEEELILKFFQEPTQQNINRKLSDVGRDLQVIDLTEDEVEKPDSNKPSRPPKIVEKKKKPHGDILARLTNRPLAYIGFHGKVIYTANSVEISRHCDEMSRQVNQSAAPEVPIAFDMEWPFNFTSGPGKTALVQMCKDLQQCYIFRVYDLPYLPAGLISLIENPKVVFHGVKVKK